jgi:hypothetical protein
MPIKIGPASQKLLHRDAVLVGVSGAFQAFNQVEREDTVATAPLGVLVAQFVLISRRQDHRRNRDVRQSRGGTRLVVRRERARTEGLRGHQAGI